MQIHMKYGDKNGALYGTRSGVMRIDTNNVNSLT